MKFAIYNDNPKTEVSTSGQRALCPTCKGEVTGKIYRDKLNHWAHLKKDCDNWYEPMSEWHLDWQNKFPLKNQEVTLADENSGELHRADILLNNGVVIEIQNSNIKIDEVEQRENFYGNNGLIWILNAGNLIPKSEFYNIIYPLGVEIEIKVFKSEYFDSDTIEITNHFKNGNYFYIPKTVKLNNYNSFYSFLWKTDYPIFPENIKNDFNDSLESMRWKHYRYYDLNEFKERFEIKTTITSNKFEVIKSLSINHRKKFIELMKFPVFLDNIKGLDRNYLYWLQKEKIIKKKDFLNKYLKYT